MEIFIKKLDLKKGDFSIAGPRGERRKKEGRKKEERRKEEGRKKEERKKKEGRKKKRGRKKKKGKKRKEKDRNGKNNFVFMSVPAGV